MFDWLLIFLSWYTLILTGKMLEFTDSDTQSLNKLVGQLT